MKLLITVIAIGLVSETWADVRLPNIISSGMVLQRHVAAPVWGKADPGERVTVTFAGQSKSATAGKNGRWMIKLAPCKTTNVGRDLVITGNNAIRLTDVVVGEVWLASGQSNMEWNLPVISSDEKKVAIAAKDNKFLRMFCVADRIGLPIKNFFRGNNNAGTWSKATEFLPKFEQGQILKDQGFSAVGFFFGLKLAKELQIPVAVIDSSWGGTTIERWIADEGMKEAGLKFTPATDAQTKQMDEYQKQLVNSVETWLESAKEALPHGENVPFTAELRPPVRHVINEVYNGMIHPLVPFAFKGTIWYQGESNVGRRKTYGKSLKGLINGWRKVFNNPDMSFHIVMLAPYTGYDRQGKTIMPNDIWQKQMRVADEIEGSEVVTIHDTAEPKSFTNLHPPGKLSVGNRLAENVLSKVYGKNIPAAGPKFKGAKRDGAKVIVEFSGIDKGLSARGGKKLTWFELSADNKTFVKAKAILDGDKVIVTARGVAAPTHVRMGWSNAATPNLQDQNGWPAFPFPAQKIK